MYIENIQDIYHKNIALAACSLKQYHLHCHEDGIEIFFVLKGLADVKVVFENFVLKEGDYIVIDKGDPHSIKSIGGLCQVISIYIKTEPYKNQFPFIDYVWFTCESFDLVKYSNQTNRLRNMISEIIFHLMQNSTSHEEKLQTKANRLIEILIQNYDIRNYYNRGRAVSKIKMEKYYKIMKYIYENCYMKNLQDYIATQEHYSKSYIIHLFKEVGGIGFQDILTYERISKSLTLLLTGNLNIDEIADRCGFSSVKYYSRDFKKWFSCTPSKYRSCYRHEVDKEDIFEPLSDKVVKNRVKALERVEDHTEYKISINPLSLKVFGATYDDFITCSDGLPLAVHTDAHGTEGRQQVFIRIKETNQIVRTNLIRGIASFEDAGYSPFILIYFKDLMAKGCRQTMGELADILGAEKASDLKVCIIYSDLGQRQSVAALVKEGETILASRLIEAALMV